MVAAKKAPATVGGIPVDYLECAVDALKLVASQEAHASTKSFSPDSLHRFDKEDTHYWEAAVAIQRGLSNHRLQVAAEKARKTKAARAKAKKKDNEPFNFQAD